MTTTQLVINSSPILRLLQELIHTYVYLNPLFTTEQMDFTGDSINIDPLSYFSITPEDFQVISLDT